VVKREERDNLKIVNIYGDKIYGMSSVPINKVDNVLKEFFVQDGGITETGPVRKSTILSCRNDFAFLRGIVFYDGGIGLSSDQIKKLNNKIPSFAAILVYCSAIDLLARVMKRKTGERISRKYFLWSSRRWFGHSKAESLALWNLRCGVSHQYKIERGLTAVPFGFSGPIRYNRSTKKWEFNLNGMFGSIKKAISKANDYIMEKKIKTRHNYAVFIYEHGFFYVS
jgi:hypothetical protein